MKKYTYYILLFLASIQPLKTNAASTQPFVDLLAWRAAESNSSWATTLTFPSATITHFVPSNINFDTRTGVKAGFSYTPEDSFWDTKLYWTYFPSNTTQNIALNAQIVTSLFFSGSYFISQDLFFGGSTNWKLALNTLDLEASHHFNPMPSLTFTPKMGAKGGTINQDIHALWDAFFYTSTEDVTNDFTGIGPSFGLEAKWGAYPNLNFIGNISTALMYGKWNVSDVYVRPFVSGITTATTISTSMNHAMLGTLMMDYYLGLEWVYHGRTRIAFKLGYEAQYWANQLRLITVQQLPTLGDLTIQGATCGIFIDL